MEVSKSDWKLFRTRIGDWQEAYMERLVKEYMDLLVRAENASDKRWNDEENGVVTEGILEFMVKIC